MEINTFFDCDFKSIKGPNDKIRKLLLELAEPAAEISSDGRVKDAFRIRCEYLRGKADAEALAQAQAVAESAGYLADNHQDRNAAWAVAEALFSDRPHFAKFVKQVAWYAAQAVAHYKASKAPDYHAAYQEAWAAHRKHQEEVVSNWMEGK